MLQKDKTYYTYKDLTIVPTCISVVEHRAECSPYDNDEMLPLFTAPMDTVVNKDNFDLFESEGIHAILPRTEPIDDRLNFSKAVGRHIPSESSRISSLGRMDC